VNILFFFGVVLIWGTTWLAIKFQLGVVDPMVSVAYRFALASSLLMAYCIFARLKMKFSLREHLYMIQLGGFLFALNYWLFYSAEVYLASGLVAVVFSLMVVLNILFGALFLGSPIRMRVVAGALLGFSGIGLVFWKELSSFSLEGGGFLGLGLSLAATVSASLGNITSARNQRDGLPVIQANAYGMAYGSAFMFIFSVLLGKEFLFEMTVPYVSSLVYLALFGSIAAFGMYLTLIGRIGADRTAYTTLLFPLVALGLSAVFEGYRWDNTALIGVMLILAGNVLVLTRVNGALQRVKAVRA